MSMSLSDMSMSVADVEKVQALYPEHFVELRAGKIILKGFVCVTRATQATIPHLPLCSSRVDCGDQIEH